jgi:Trypsin-like peptidase domain
VRPAEAPWALRLHDENTGRVLGAGFLVAPQLALTCRHVIGNMQNGSVKVDFACRQGKSGKARPDNVVPAMIAADVMILHLDEPAGDIPVAPIGPAEPPPAGTLLTAFGFPSMPVPPHVQADMRESLAHPGVWAQLVVDGSDLRAERIQLTSLAAHGMPVKHGFSGGPVMDQEGYVVGMLAAGAEAYRMALMIPVRALAACSPVLRRILLPDLSSDPQLARGVKALNSRDYATALADFRGVCARRPEHPDSWFYVALAALAGKRPRAHYGPYIEEIGRLLEQASSLSPKQPHVLALWAVIKEDYYHAFGFDEGIPTAANLSAAADSVNVQHAAEICNQVQAPETPTWRRLQQRRIR